MPDLATDPSDLAAAKKRARNDARDVRAEAKATTGPLAGNLLQAQFLDNVPMPPNGVVAGYWPMNDEMNPVPLLKRLIKDGVQCALPGNQMWPWKTAHLERLIRRPAQISRPPAS